MSPICLVQACLMIALLASFVWMGLILDKLSKETYVNDKHELVDSRGAPIRTLRSKSFATLTDLPALGYEFFEGLQSLSIYLPEGEVLHLKISGYTWKNYSYLELETTRKRSVIITGGKAFLRDDATRKILHMTRPASEPKCGRRLSNYSGHVAKSQSWEELLHRYHHEASIQRRLGEGAGNTQDLVRWFGAIIFSDAVRRDAEQRASEALQASYCEYDTKGLECAAYESSLKPKPPAFNSGLNRLLLSGSDGLWLLYFDVSDWQPDSRVPDRQRRVRSKLASGVTVNPHDTTGSEIQVYEHTGLTMMYYQMLHPSVLPSRYNLSVPLVSDQGLSLAEEVLESRSYDSFKGGCQKQTLSGDDERKAAYSQVSFNCEDGTFTYSVAGWLVTTSADGTVQALMFAMERAGDLDNQTDVTTLNFRVHSITDGANERKHYRLSEAFKTKAIFTGCEAHEGESSRLHQDGTRRLMFSVRLPSTSWCGPGQCGSDMDGCRHNYCLNAYDGDWACRKHDACSKVSSLAGVPILACSCNKELLDNRGHGDNADLIKSIFGNNGLVPCISHVKTCYSFGWVKSRRRRRWFGWSYWGITGRRSCDDWNYINKYNDPKLQRFGYHQQIYGYSLDSQQSWPGCVPNTRDREVPDALIWAYVRFR